MPFIGNQPAEAFSSFQKQDFTTSATTSYTLDHPVSNGNEIALFINFVRQEPTAAYTASGTSLTLTSATSASDDMYCVFLGKAVQTVNPASGSVGSSQVAASIITGQTALGATPADTDELLISDAGTLKRVDYSYLKVSNTPAFEAKMSADQTISDDVVTKVQFDTETFDTDSCYDNSTNYRFTPTTAGKYYVYSTVRTDSTSNSTIAQVDAIIYKNGSAYSSAGSNFSTNYIAEHAPTVTSVIDFNGSTDYVEMYVRNNATGGTLKVQADTFTTSATFGAYKIIGA